jgi:hypothetical protein
MAIIFKGEGDSMVRVKVVLLLFLAGAISGFCGLAAESNGLSGTIGAEATFLPEFSTYAWFDLDWDVDGWSIGNLAEITAFPGFAVNWTGNTVMVDVYPFAFGGFDVYAEVGLFDIAQGEFEVSADAGLFSEIYPTFGNTLSLDVDASYGIFSLWGEFDLDIPGFGLSVLMGGEARVLDLDLNNGSLTADLGASTFVVPAVDASMWLDVVLTLGGVTVTAETDFTLTPFGLTQQWLEAEIGFDTAAIYVWIEFTGAGDLSAGIGGTYDFP